jgi:hypothetical protein
MASEVATIVRQSPIRERQQPHAKCPTDPVCPQAFGDTSVARSGPSLVRGWPLAPVGVGGHQYAIKVELKELFLIGADSGWTCGRNDRCL